MAAERAAAEARRLDAARADTRQAERLLGALAAERDEAREQAAAATRARAEAEAARAGREAEARERAEAEAVRARAEAEARERAQADAAQARAEAEEAIAEARREADTLREARDAAMADAARARVEGEAAAAQAHDVAHSDLEERWAAATDEVGALRAALEVAAGDRKRLEEELRDAVRERDELRGRLETARDGAVVPTPTPADATDVLGASRRRRAGTIGIGVLAGTGALLVADAAATVLWQEPVSRLLADHAQSNLSRELSGLDVRLGALGPPPPPQQTPAQRMAQLAGTLQATADPGDPVGRLRIPRTGDTWVVVQGSGSAQLRKGPGHYPSTSLPGRPGTTAIAGHRTTYAAPFRHLDALAKGDRLVMRMPYGTFTYRVDRRRIVSPTNVAVLRDVGHPELVLTACHPLYSAKQRIVVSARLVVVRPRLVARD